MYWVMTESTEATVAMTYDKNIADWIANTYDVPCIVRFAQNK